METLTLPDKALFRPVEVAEFLCVHLSTIQHWCKDGKLKAIRLSGGDYRIPRASILELLDNPVVE